MNKQCKFCIHSDVCAYKEHYENAVDLYEKARNECSKYPYFKCDIVCTKQLKKVAQRIEKHRAEEVKAFLEAESEG